MNITLTVGIVYVKLENWTQLNYKTGSHRAYVLKCNWYNKINISIVREILKKKKRRISIILKK